MKKQAVIFWGLLSIITTASPLKLDRVILAVDNNSKYLDFWPMAAKAWKQIVGVEPTLAFIADESAEIDESLGDVYRFPPIEGVTPGNYASAIRLLFPMMFENEGCIIADIDMVPMSKDYFHDSVADVPGDHFVVYRDGAWGAVYNGEKGNRYPMCYLAAQGSTFKEVFGIGDIADIPAMVQRWFKLGFKRATDERVMFAAIHDWESFDTRCTRLGHGSGRRIGRRNWQYDKESVESGYFIDAHFPRPYKQYKNKIDALVALLNLK